MQLSSSLSKQPPFMFLTVHRGLLMLLTLSGRGRLSHPPSRSTIQSKKTPDLYTEEEEEEIKISHRNSGQVNKVDGLKLSPFQKPKKT